MEDLFREECEHFQYWPSNTYDVIYDWQEVDFQTHFSDLVAAIQNFVRTLIERFDDVSALEEPFEKLYEHFCGAWLKLKHAAFHEEQEYRMVVGVTPKSLFDSYPNACKMDVRFTKNIHCRPGIHGSVPYIRLFEGLAENLPICRIMVGPSRNQLATFQKVQELTRHMEIAVHVSKTPFVESILTLKCGMFEGCFQSSEDKSE